MEIPDCVKEIRSVHFSLAGQAEASMFSDRILRLADAKMLKYKSIINDRARYFYKICHEFCRELNIAPDRNYTNELHSFLGTNNTMALTLSSGKNPDLTIDIPTNPQKEEGRGPSLRVAQQEFASEERSSAHQSDFARRFQEYKKKVAHRNDPILAYEHECIFPLYYCHQIKYHRTYAPLD